MALYNDERPRRYSEVLGQEIVVKQMKRKHAENRFPQTVIATGPRGTGKTTCLRISAKAVNCENLLPDGEPCCECASCREIEAGISPSVIELDAATNNGVDDVRRLVEQSRFVPVGKKLVFIWDEVHMFSNAAWNALLKTLEEPPANVIFMLATTELQKVPVTVLSRCLRFDFQKISREVMSDYIFELCKKYNLGIEPGALSLIVTQAEGCMRDALSLLDQFVGCDVLETETVLDFLGLASDDVVFDVLTGMCNGDANAANEVIEGCENRGKSILSVVKGILEALTYATAYKAGGGLPPQSEEYNRKLVSFAEAVSVSKLNQITGTFLQVYPMLQKNLQLTFLLKAAITNVVSSESLLSRLEREVENLKERPVKAPNECVHGNMLAVETESVEQEQDEVLNPVQNAEQSAEGPDDTEKVVPFPVSVVNDTTEHKPETQEAVSDDEWARYFRNVPEFDNMNMVMGSQEVHDLFEDSMSTTMGEVNPKCPETDNVPEATKQAEEDIPDEGMIAGELRDGNAMSFDEMMAAMESGTLPESAPVSEAVTTEEYTNMQEEEEEPAVAQEVELDFDEFDFFMSGGDARL